MNESASNPQPSPKWLRLIARIWSAPIILYALITALGYTWSWLTTGVADPYGVEGTSFIEALPPILMFISVLGLAAAWRWERLGGLLSLVFIAGVILLLILQGLTSDEFSRFLTPSLLCLLIIVPGVLFLIHSSSFSRKP